MVVEKILGVILILSSLMWFWFALNQSDKGHLRVFYITRDIMAGLLSIFFGIFLYLGIVRF
jgi:hypothetical protein